MNFWFHFVFVVGLGLSEGEKSSVVSQEWNFLGLLTWLNSFFLPVMMILTGSQQRTYYNLCLGGAKGFSVIRPQISRGTPDCKHSTIHRSAHLGPGI